MVVVVAGLCLGAGVVSANQPPLADAGLDQEVQQGATVYLDAGGSTDPDGTIDAYRWQIVAPDGTTRSPACPSCERTHFLANQSGEYNVTVTVTDDGGAARSDTLVVDVAQADPPSVTLTGPSSVTADGSHTYRAAVSSGGVALSTLTWERNGTTLGRTDLDTREATRARTLSFDTHGSPTLSVAVSDVAGRTAEDSVSVDVASLAPSNDGSTGNGVSATGGSLPSDGHGYFEEIVRNHVTGTNRYTYTFRFRGDDDVASNKVSPRDSYTDTMGTDPSGYGVKRATLRRMYRSSNNVNLIEDSGGLTKYRISGEIAENFEDNGDVHSPGVRVGTTDMITEQDMTGSPRNSHSGSDLVDSSRSVDLKTNSDPVDNSPDVDEISRIGSPPKTTSSTNVDNSGSSASGTRSDSGSDSSESEDSDSEHSASSQYSPSGSSDSPSLISGNNDDTTKSSDSNSDSSSSWYNVDIDPQPAIETEQSEETTPDTGDGSVNLSGGTGSQDSTSLLVG
ncbi:MULTISPECIES: PKD domain-containing protein [Salinibaculum]|uniref:PKD domain-containing protein n=1 Tax=Salinibaculum TaxID=2732368 RepID=UPI0030CEC29F